MEQKIQEQIEASELIAEEHYELAIKLSKKVHELCENIIPHDIGLTLADIVYGRNECSKPACEFCKGDDNNGMVNYCEVCGRKVNN